MSEETVRVVVEQQGRGSAVRDAVRDLEELKKRARATVEAENPQTVAKIKELNKTAAEYEARAAREDINPNLREAAAQSAKSVRAEAKVLQKDLNRATAEEVIHQKAVTREHLQQQAVQRQQAAAQRITRQNRAGLRLAEYAVGASGMDSGLANAAMTAVGGTIGIALGAALAVVSVALSFVVDKIDLAAKRAGKNLEARQQMESIAGKSGVEGQEAASSAFFENRKALEAARSKRGTFADEGIADALIRTGRQGPHGFGPFGSLGRIAASFMKTSGEKGERENENDIKDRERREAELRKLADEKFVAGPGGIDLAAQEKRLNYDERSAKNLELRSATLREYNRLWHEGASEERAEAGAGTFAKLAERGEMAKFTRLVTARSGAGDIARAAGLASGEFGGTGGSAAAIMALHETVRAQHQEAMGTRSIPNGLGRDRP